MMRKIKSASAASSPKIPSADRSSNTTPMSKHSRSASTPGQLGRQVGHAVQHSEMQGNECRSQQHQPYLLHDGTVLNKTVAERDIGVKVDNGLKPTQQSKQAANRANHILYQLTKAFNCRDRRTFVKLYKECQTPSQVRCPSLVSLDSQRLQR